MHPEELARPAAPPETKPSTHPRLAGWGRYPTSNSEVYTPGRPKEAVSCLSSKAPLALRGNGRSYGDAAIGAQVVSSICLNNMLDFDAATGRLRAEAGVLIGDVIRAFLPRGWFPFVTPGTQFVTLGGAVAADVHGKNHHGEGGFSRYVESFLLATPNDGVVLADRESEPELFAATVGGMGLTGMILEVTLRLRPVETGYVRQKTIATTGLAHTLKVLKAETGSTYSVAWIDCLAQGHALGRSLVYLGEHASREDMADGALFPSSRPSGLRAPVDAPSFVLNPTTMRIFNDLYYRKGALQSGATALVGWQSYFYPLDGVLEWNRIYGRRGFVQHQCVIPSENAEPAMREILALVSARGCASFLAVLKGLGGAEGLISFPMPGFTLTLDMPVRDDLFQLLAELDQIVVAAGGRLYLAKDATQSRDTFLQGYPQVEKFKAVRRALQAQKRLNSLQSERLSL